MKEIRCNKCQDRGYKIEGDNILFCSCELGQTKKTLFVEFDDEILSKFDISKN